MVQYLPTDPDDPGSGGNPSPTPSDYGTLVFTQPITKRDGGSALRILCYLNCAAVDDLRFSSYLFVDDTIVQVGTTNLIFDNYNSNAMGTMTVLAIVDGIAAGARQVRLRVRNRDSSALTILAGSIIEVTELRQASR